MDLLKKWIRNVFGFSGKEINGFLVLLPLTVILITSLPLYKAWRVARTDDFSHDRNTLDSLAQLWSTPSPRVDTTLTFTLFEFDPNKASVNDMRKLGFSEHLSNRIANYRRKGGKFNVKSDLLKIYGLDSTFYRQLYTYILLPETRKWKNETQRAKPATESQKVHLVSFDLNRADTTQLKSVYGIGSKLAARIVKFRDGLGGFVNPGQIREIYGLDSLVVNELTRISFIAADFTPKKININTASETEISAHPYIRKSVAKAIVAYRFQHGQFTTVQDIQKLSLLKPEDAARLAPYLTIAD